MKEKVVLVIAFICRSSGAFFVEFLDIILGRYLVGIAGGLFLADLIFKDESNN